MVGKSVLIALGLAGLALLLGSSAEAKSYRAERFDVQLDLQADGSLIVLETIEFHFTGGPFTYVFRDVAATETDGLAFLEASLDGLPLPQGNEVGQVEVTGRDPLRVKWRFPPSSDTAHVFALRYRAAGVLRQGVETAVIWRAIPQRHDYPVRESAITLTCPPSAMPIEEPTLGRDHQVSRLDDGFCLTTQGIARNQSVVLRARFAPGSLTAGPPVWQARRLEERAAIARLLPIGILAGIAGLSLGLVGWARSVLPHRRDRRERPSTAAPPAEVAPAVVGRLARKPRALQGTIFDLARRGLLEIHQDRGFLGTKEFRLHRTGAAGPLSRHEQVMLSALFEAGKDRIKLGQIAGRLARRRKDLEKLLDDELLDRGWLDAERKQMRSRLLSVWGLVSAGAILLAVLGYVGAATNLLEQPQLALLMSVLAGAGTGLLLASVLGVLGANSLSVLSIAGEEQAARWEAFREHLQHVGKEKTVTVRPDLFETYLPLAAVFGLGQTWAKRFRKRADVALPVWFQPLEGHAADFGTMVALMGVSDSSGPGGGGGAGGGASGGGGSGAG